MWLGLRLGPGLHGLRKTSLFFSRSIYFFFLFSSLPSTLSLCVRAFPLILILRTVKCILGPRFGALRLPLPAHSLPSEQNGETQMVNNHNPFLQFFIPFNSKHYKQLIKDFIYIFWKCVCHPCSTCRKGNSVAACTAHWVGYGRWNEDNNNKMWTIAFQLCPSLLVLTKMYFLDALVCVVGPKPSWVGRHDKYFYFYFHVFV